MGDESAVDIIKRLIVGRRGRGRADRLLCFDAAGAQKAIAVKSQTPAGRYVDLVLACHPVRIEAYAAKELVDAWETPEPQDVPPEAQTPAPRPTSAALRKKKRGVDDRVMQITSHVNQLLASAHRDSGKTTAERDATVWKAMVDIAQTQNNLAANFESKLLLAEKVIRIRDKQLRERDELILKLHLKIAELSMGESEDKNSTAFFKLLEHVGVAKDGKLADIARVMSDASKAATPATPATTNGKAKPKEPAS